MKKCKTGLTAAAFPLILRAHKHVLAGMLVLLFLVSSQLCYAMTVGAAFDGDGAMSMSQSVSAHHGGQSTSKDMDMGAKAPAACVMMVCGCIVQFSTGFVAQAVMQDFGSPPRVVAMAGKGPYDLLRPPILQN